MAKVDHDNDSNHMVSLAQTKVDESLDKIHSSVENLSTSLDTL